MAIGLTPVLSWVGQNDLARGVVPVKREEDLFPDMSVGHDNGAEGVVIKGHRRIIKKVNVEFAHIFKFCKTLCLFCNCVVYNILFHGGKVVTEQGTGFIIRSVMHLKALLCRALWRRVVAALSCSLATSTWTACTIWHLECAKGVAVGAPAASGGSLGGFGTIPDVLELEAKSNGGPPGLSQHKIFSKSSMRQQRSVCLCE